METQKPYMPRLLIVDDEPGVLKALQRILQDESYQLLTASGGQSALELLQETGPVELIISDYRMPGMTGVAFLQQVMQRWPDTRRIILSAYPDSDVLLAALNEGRVHRFLVKPWDNDTIKAVIREMLAEYDMLVNFRQGTEELARSNRLLSRTNEHLSTVLADVLSTMRREAVLDDGPAQPLPADVFAAQTLHQPLSVREREVMLKIATGHSAKAIAADLEISIKTVSTYKKRLFDKMGFKHDAELIGYAIKNNLLP